MKFGFRLHHNFSIFLIIIFVILNIVAGTVVGILLWHNYQAYKQAYKQGKFVVYKSEDILEGATTRPPIINVNFAKQTAFGSPLIFGGVHSPNLEHGDAWNKLQEIGVTLIRRGFFLEHEAPQNITLDDYRKNINDVQNPKNWNINQINNTNKVLSFAQNRGIKVMGILIYSPSWLTYSGKSYGVPKNWDIYEDIIKKIYKLHRPFLNYIEIWNEPDLNSFLDISGSGLTKEDAYKLIYMHASKAIRSVDREANDGKIVPIGGPSTSSGSDISYLEKILQLDSSTNPINFISYHNYTLTEPSWNQFKEILNNNNKSSLPVFITEWNYSAEENTNFNSSNPAISFVGSKFIDFLEMGLTGANYYVLLPINREKVINDNPNMGFYKWENNQATLLPQAKTWRLMSKTLALGKGQSKVMETLNDESINAVGFENVDKKQGMAIVNETDFGKIVEVNFLNLRTANKTVSITGYLASADNDGANPTGTQHISIQNGSLSFKLYLPPQSVVGVLLNQM